MKSEDSREFKRFFCRNFSKKIVFFKILTPVKSGKAKNIQRLKKKKIFLLKAD